MLRLFLISVACFVFAFGCAPPSMPKWDPVESRKKDCARNAPFPSMSSFAEAKLHACEKTGVDISTVNNYWTFFDKCLYFFNPDLTINIGALATFYCEVADPFAIPLDCASKIKGTSIKDAAQKLAVCEKSQH